MLEEGVVEKLERKKENLPSTCHNEIAPEACERITGHEDLIEKVCSLVEKEAKACLISLLKIYVRPTWSQESDERTGIVVDAKVQATSEARNQYWDTVCDRLNQLEDDLSLEESRFLTNEVFFVVSRG